MKLKNGLELELYFNEKDTSYEGSNKWVKTDHYSVVEIEDVNGQLYIRDTLLRSERKNDCISFMNSLYKKNNVVVQRSYLYKKYKDL